jgi:7,8-dihydropterin-6-yl-methyl-4-(beta-D-ribofuranosyl)aminobenzene 5'-phosphate synthase
MSTDKIPEILEVKATILSENTAGPLPVLAEWGLSTLVETKFENGHVLTILLDTGTTGDVLLHNAKVLDVNLSAIDAIAMSHGHYDHSGGLLKLLERIGKRLPVILHPDALQPKFSIERFGSNGLKFPVSELHERAEVVPVVSPFWFHPRVLTTGTVARETSFEKVKGFSTVKDGQWEKDILQDDLSLILNLGERGLMIFTGCAHSGVCNTIRTAKKATGNDKIYGIVGGFHLIGATNDRIELTIRELQSLDVEILAPCHCTGFPAIKQIANTFPKVFHHTYAGDTILLSF